VFGCDICQEVCPWNRKGLGGGGEARLEELAGLSEAEFEKRFGGTAVERVGYRGFLRNVAAAMGNK
jgi:epoxyqueuosine reductase